MAAESFREYDTDGSGELSFAEFNAAMSDFDLGLAPEQVRLLMNWLDTDGNGQISFEEFISKFKVEFSKEAAKNRHPNAPRSVSVSLLSPTHNPLSAATVI